MKDILYVRKHVSLLLTILSLILIGNYSVSAQTDQWAWISGDNTNGNAGVYGTKGIVDPANKPGSRVDMATWVDAAGNLLLFGGLGFDFNGTNGQLNDLWKYSPATNEWTWMGGSTTADAGSVYGTKGMASAGNQPGGRHFFSTWKDNGGNLWLFGGDGTDANGNAGILNDLWKYDPVAGQWTWVNGDNTGDNPGSYGTKGVPASSNKPGGRRGAITWTDQAGNLWLFGGDGYPGVASETYMNDLWKYDPVSNQWTWISGEDTVGPTGVSGTKGVAAATNEPGGRWSAVSWLDRNNNLWLFGGDGNNAMGGFAFMNDLWKYDPVANQWTWISGSGAPGATGVYGTAGIADPANTPGARYEMISWTDTNHDLWLLGGDGFAASGGSGFLNDLWKYTVASNTWTWENGANFTSYPAIYGTKGVAATSNQPGARLRFASWLTTDNTLWIFGGANSSGFLNDLWQYKPNIVLLASGFLNFTATRNCNEALLAWQVPAEQNNGHFNVQHSTDGLHWQTVTDVSTIATDGENGSYRYTDAYPVMGTNYYRLQQEDAAGRISYSRVAELSFSSSLQLIWQPAGEGMAKIQLSNGYPANYQLLGVDGKTYRRGTLQNGQVLISGLQPGVYIMQVMAGRDIFTQKLMIR